MSIRFVLVVVAGIMLLGQGASGSQRGVESRLPFERSDTIQRTLRVPAGGAQVLELSNLSGAIEITGGSGGTIDVVAERTVRGMTQADLETAMRASTPVTTESASGVTIRGSGELWHGCDEDNAWRGREERRRSHVVTRFAVRVPQTIAVRVCAVNGAVEASGVRGPLTVTTVNGAIDAKGVDNPVRLHTVNGAVTADVRLVPSAAWSLHTVNGDVTLRLPASTSADLALETMNGGLFTDFETTPLPAAAPIVDRVKGMRVYRNSRTVHVRVGRGGPRLMLETLNGDVMVRSR